MSASRRRGHCRPAGGAWSSVSGDDRVGERADAVDSARHDVAGLEEDGFSAEGADTVRSSGADDVSWLQRDPL
ncbi:MAG TPA: hypothetical protein VMA72_24395 [Streptosporangiaceae bacterium]|nr:hypothetical protein [Streptosporangiaceae bacterium]